MIKEPMVIEIAKNTYAINEFGLSACYFLIGEERALLIDTACGLSDLKSIAASLTDKPYDVVLTHGHHDHIGGIGAFSDVYLQEDDFEMVRNVDVEVRRNFAEEQAATKRFPMIRKKFSRLKDYQSFMLCTRVTALNLETVVWNVLRLPAIHRAASVFWTKLQRFCFQETPAIRIFLCSDAV